MSSLLTVLVLISYNWQGATCSEYVEMYINNERIDIGDVYTRRYYFEPDKIVNVTCKTLNKTHSLMFRWNQSNGTKINETSKMHDNLISQRIQLSSAYNNTYIVCAIFGEIPNFKVVLYETVIPQLFVNNELVNSEEEYRDNITNSWAYKGYYYFVPNEDIDIRCNRSDTIQPSWRGRYLGGVTNNFVDHTIRIKPMKSHNNTKLLCIYRQDDYSVSLYVSLYVKTETKIKHKTEDSVEMYINNERIQTQVRRVDNGYFYTGRYYYEPDTTVNVTCKTLGKPHRLIVRWNQNNDTNIIENSKRRTHKISQDIQLTSAHNNTYIVCAIIGEIPNFRVILYERVIPQLFVNKKLVNSEEEYRDNITNSWVYKGYYYFVPNEYIEIRCNRSDTIQPSWIGRYISGISNNFRDHTIRIQPIQSHNNTKLSCVYTQDGYDATLFVSLYVKTETKIKHKTEAGPKIFINGKIVASKKTDNDVEHDYLGSYHFEEDESVNVTCFGPETTAGGFDQIKMQLKSGIDGRILTETNYTKDHAIINFKLSREHQLAYLVCSYKSHRIKEVLKVYMYLKGSGTDFPTWAIVLMNVFSIAALIVGLLSIIFIQKRCKPAQTPQQSPAEHVYEEIPENARQTSIRSPDYGRELRRIPGLKVDMKTGVLNIDPEFVRQFHEEQKELEYDYPYSTTLMQR